MWPSPSDPGAPRDSTPRPAPRAAELARNLRWSAAAALLAGCVSGPVRTFRSSLERARSGSNEQTTQSNLIELSAQDHVGNELEYRLDEKFTFSSQDNSGTGGGEDQTSLNRPSLDVAWTSGPLRWSQLFQRQVDRSQYDHGPDNTLVRDDLLQKLEWTPEHLPQLTAWVDYRRVEDDYSVEQERFETLFQVRQLLSDFEYDYTFRGETIDDLDADVESQRREHLGRATYTKSSFDARLTTTLSAFIAERSNDVEVPIGSSALQFVVPVQTFADVDFTPQVSALPINLALNDGNLTNSTGVDIGGFASGGQVSWNLAAEINLGNSVDFIDLHTVDVVPPSFVSGFAFSIWASDDNTFWTLIKSSAAYTYDPVNLRFRIATPNTSRRFVKVVNAASPAAAPAVLITELRLQRAGGAGTSNSSRTEDSTRNGTAALSWRASESLTVGADLFLQSAQADFDGAATRDESRVDAGLWTNWSPTSKVDASLRVADQRLEDPIVRDEDLLTVLATLSYRPIRTVDLDLSYTDTDRDVDGSDDLQTRAAQLLGSAQLLRRLRGELGLERNLTDDTTNQREIARWVLTAALIAELTARWQVTLRARDDDAEVSGAGAAGIPPPSEEHYEATVVYRPSEHLIAELELDWIESFAGDGLDQRLRLDWIPFGDGTLDLQFDFDRTRTESFSQTQIDRWRALSRWSLSSNTYFELQYLAEFPDQGPSAEIATLGFAFSG